MPSTLPIKIRIGRFKPSSFGASALLFACALVRASAQAQIPSSITLTTSPNPSTLGQPAVLTAIVPQDATGSVTLFDTYPIVGMAPVNTRPKASACLLHRRQPVPGQSFPRDRSYGHRRSIGQVQGRRVPGPQYPTGVVAGDFDKDGFTDILIAADTGLALFRGRGQGVFTPAGTYPLAGVSDVNGDGVPDLVSNQYGIGLVSAGVYPTTAAVAFTGNPLKADFNGNGRLDDGDLWPSLPCGMDPHHPAWGLAGVLPADINGDGNADVFCVSFMLGGRRASAAQQLGRGDGTFDEPSGGCSFLPVNLASR